VQLKQIRWLKISFLTADIQVVQYFEVHKLTVFSITNIIICCTSIYIISESTIMARMVTLGLVALATSRRRKS
jgi:hypothetical protein